MNKSAAGMRIAVMLALLVVVAVHAAHAESGTAAAGQWINEGCALTEYDPATGRFEGVGTTDWVGTWTGVTTYTVQGTVDLFTGDVEGTIDKTFTGTADDGAIGSLYLFDTFTIDGSTFAFHLEFCILGGTGDFRGSRGWGTFDGTVIGSSGYGSYDGYWLRPNASPSNTRRSSDKVSHQGRSGPRSEHHASSADHRCIH